MEDKKTIGYNFKKDKDSKCFEPYETTFFFGIHDNNTNSASFEISASTDSEGITYGEVKNINGVVVDDDLPAINEISVSLIGSIANTKEFDSVRGDTYFIAKLSEEEYASFLS